MQVTWHHSGERKVDRSHLSSDLKGAIAALIIGVLSVEVLVDVCDNEYKSNHERQPHDRGAQTTN